MTQTTQTAQLKAEREAQLQPFIAEPIKFDVTEMCEVEFANVLHAAQLLTKEKAA